MSLTQIMSAAQLWVYPVIGLCFFLFAYAMVLWRVGGRRMRSDDERTALIPLEDDVIATPRHRTITGREDDPASDPSKGVRS